MCSSDLEAAAPEAAAPEAAAPEATVVPPDSRLVEAAAAEGTADREITAESALTSDADAAADEADDQAGIAEAADEADNETE